MTTFAVFASSLISILACGCASKTTTPSADRAVLAQAVTDGRHLWELGELGEAELKLQMVLDLETNNMAAAYYLSLVHREQVTHRRPAIFTYHKTAVTNHQATPIEQRTLKSFGSFDPSTTFEDVINRVGPPDMNQSISGQHFYFYFLPSTNAIEIHTIDASFIDCVRSGNTVLYARGTNDW